MPAAYTCDHATTALPLCAMTCNARKTKTSFVWQLHARRLLQRPPRVLHLPESAGEGLQEDRAGVFQLRPWMASAQRRVLQDLW